MTEQRDFDDLFATIGSSAEQDLRRLVAAAQAPGAADELAGEAATVAAMVDVVRRRTPAGPVARRRAPQRRVLASRSAKVAVALGVAIGSTSAAAAAGMLPEPIPAVFDRPGHSVGRDVEPRARPVATAPAEPTGQTTTTAVVEPATTSPATLVPVGVAEAVDVRSLCLRWAAGVRPGESDAVEVALVVLAARARIPLMQLCAPYEPVRVAPTADDATSPAPATAPPSTAPTVDAPAAPVAPATTDAPVVGVAPTAPVAPPTPARPPDAAPAVPPQAGNGPPPSPPGQDEAPTAASAKGTPDEHADENANGSADARADGDSSGNGNGAAAANGATPHTDATANRNGNGNGNGGERGHG